MESLGDADTLEAQSKAILMENDIRDEEFSDEVKRKENIFYYVFK
jgi:exoribonuclease R